MYQEEILRKYSNFKDAGKLGFLSTETRDSLIELLEKVKEYLGTVSIVDLFSSVPGKEYFAFEAGGKISRAINKSLYINDIEKTIDYINSISCQKFDFFDVTTTQKILYSGAISFCASIDLLKSGDQKTPGTFFEYFVGFLFTSRIGLEPKNYIDILNDDNSGVTLKTDYIFNLGAKKQKFHLPIKTSTRERSIMLWAHQRLLDGVYGIEKYMGTPVLLTETKIDKRKREVTEICLPAQWRVYQSYIARMKRIYYFDPPEKYLSLNNEFPPIIVKPFSDFFEECETLLPT